MKLYEISQAIRDLLSTLNDSGGELTDNEIALLDQLAEARADKFDACCSLIREWEAFVTVRKAEIDRLKAGIKTHENNIRRLKKYMQDDLERFGESEMQTAIFKAYVQRSPASCDLVDGMTADQLPADYQRVSVEPNKQKALETWKRTGKPPEGFVVKQESHLRIR